MRNRRTELEEGAAGIRKPASVPLFSVAAKAYLDLKKPNWEERTLRFETYNLSHLLPVFGKSFVADIEAEEISQYQTARLAEGASHRTVNMEVGTLRAILKRSGHWARLLPDITMLKVPLSKGKVMPLEVRAAVLAACRQSRSRSLYYVVVLTAETGSRKSPVKMIRWENVDFCPPLSSVGQG
jgi:integrase